MKSWLDSLPSSNQSLRRVAAIVAMAALLSIYAVEVTLTSRALSATWNEPYHLLAGYTYWQRADYGVNPEHPPLAKLVGALPLLIMHLHTPRVGKDDSSSPPIGWGLISFMEMTLIRCSSGHGSPKR